jgi:hypothetical protein
MEQTAVAGSAGRAYFVVPFVATFEYARRCVQQADLSEIGQKGALVFQVLGSGGVSVGVPD